MLLAIEGITILLIGRLIWEHLFVGMLLIGPVLLKLASTGYRFVRYYSGSPPYRRKGPPPLLLRASAPLVVLTSVLIIVSGVILLFAGPGVRSTLLPVHKISFFVWLAFMTLHVLGHLPGIPRALRADYGHTERRMARERGRSGRQLALSGALLAGVVIAILTIPQFGPWLNRRHNDGRTRPSGAAVTTPAPRPAARMSAAVPRARR